MRKRSRPPWTPAATTAARADRLHPLKLSARDGVAAGVLAVLAVCVGLADALL